MNIQDEMDRIFKVQQDNLENERKFIQRCKNGVGEWEVLPNFETFDTRKEAEDFLDKECERKFKELGRDFINFQDDFYNLLEKYGVDSIDIEHPEFNKICNLRNKVFDFIENEVAK